MSVKIAASDSMEFRWPLRVYIEDTDAGGIVYYVNYLKYMERARTEYLRSLDFEKNDFEKNAFKKTGIEKPDEKNSADDNYIFTDDLMFVVQSMAVNYHKPARLDDELIATARIVASGAAQLRFEQRILRGSEALCGGEVKIVCVDRRTMKPRRIPSVLLDALLI